TRLDRRACAPKLTASIIEVQVGTWILYGFAARLEGDSHGPLPELPAPTRRLPSAAPWLLHDLLAPPQDRAVRSLLAQGLSLRSVTQDEWAITPNEREPVDSGSRSS